MNAENEGAIESLINVSQKISLARTRKYYYYTLIPFSIGLIWLIFSFSQVKNLNSKINNLSDSIASAKKNLGNYRDSIRSEKQNLELLKYLKDSLQIEYLRYLQSGKGIQAGYNILEQSILANNYLKSQFNKFNINKTLNIWYFQKTIDAERIQLALSELGYMNVRVTPTDNSFLIDGETNSVAFGSEVKFDDLQVIILTLIRAGFKIEYVYPSERHSDRSELVQIIRTVVYNNGTPVARTPLTVEQIIKAKDKKELITR